MRTDKEPGTGKELVIEPMGEDFLLWRCLNSGPLSRGAIDLLPAGSRLPLARYRERNLPLLAKLTRVYGACAILAREGGQVVGHLRFYPKAVCGMAGAGGLCLQQDFPSGPADDLAGKDLPPLARLEDKTLFVHCMMTGSSQQKENPYRRKGIGTRMVRALIAWAKADKWERIEADSFEDLPVIYGITGCAGHTFWEKLGFSRAERRPHPALQGREPFVIELEEQAKAAGIRPERARDLIVMRLGL